MSENATPVVQRFHVWTEGEDGRYGAGGAGSGLNISEIPTQNVVLSPGKIFTAVMSFPPMM